MTSTERSLQVATSLVLAAIGVAAVLIGLDFPPAARLIPFIIGVVMAVLALVQAFVLWRTPAGPPEARDGEGEKAGLALLTDPVLARRSLVIIGASALLLPAIPLVGYALGTSLYILACLMGIARLPFRAALAVALANFAVVYVFFEFVIGVAALDGVLFSFVE